ncbi:MAG: hypothetical protein V4508_00515 [Pseudomonadota bacterium]
MPIRWVGRPGSRLALLLRGAALALCLVLAGLLVMWGLALGKRVMGPGAGPSAAQKIAALQSELARLELERARLASAVETARGETQLHARQAIQITLLEAENGKLLDDLADLASQPAPLKVHAGLAIRRAEAVLLTPRQLQLRLLLTAGAGKPLSGSVQLTVAGMQDGKPVSLTFPGTEDGAAYVLQPGQFQRWAMALELPLGFEVASLSARVVDKGQLRISQAVTVKACPSCSVLARKAK